MADASFSPTSSSGRIEDDIARLERSLRQLKIQYDMFFAGALPREPHELKANVQRLIKRYSNAPIRKYAHRFQFNSLVHRFNSFSELWSKTIRGLEEGEQPLPVVSDRAAEKVLTTCRVRDPLKEQDLLRHLHTSFVEAQRRLGSGNGQLPFDRFVRAIASQAQNLREKTRCSQIELRIIVEDRKVHLKARPGK